MKQQLGPFVVERNWMAWRTVASIAAEAPHLISVNLLPDSRVDLSESAALAHANLFANSPALLAACRKALNLAALGELSGAAGEHGRNAPRAEAEIAAIEKQILAAIAAAEGR